MFGKLGRTTLAFRTVSTGIEASTICSRSAPDSQSLPDRRTEIFGGRVHETPEGGAQCHKIYFNIKGWLSDVLMMKPEHGFTVRRRDLALVSKQ